MVLGNRSKRLLTLLTADELFHEDATCAARWAGVSGIHRRPSQGGALRVSNPEPPEGSSPTVGGKGRQTSTGLQVESAR
jgi:hypothetical protein